MAISVYTQTEDVIAIFMPQQDFADKRHICFVSGNWEPKHTFSRIADQLVVIIYRRKPGQYVPKRS